MFKKLFFVILLCLLSFNIQAVRISIITCEPGEELYASFGHTAIRVVDSLQHLDLVYNYGTFDFNTPNFYVKFARGQLNYVLSRGLFQNFMLLYQFENRGVTEQVLDLTENEAKSIFNFLENNYLPENRYYLYDFFLDNCATRVRDVFTNALGTNLLFDNSNEKQHKTFRDAIEPYLENSSWSKLGIYLAVGYPSDRIMKSAEYQFLPDSLFSQFAKAKFASTGKLIVKETNKLFISEKKENSFNLFLSTKFIFTIILIVCILLMLLEKKYKINIRWFDFLLFFIIGLVGTILFLLWTATDHKATINNFNLIWAVPTHLFAAILLLKKSKPLWLEKYFLICAIINSLLIICWKFSPQVFDNSLLLLILVMTFRQYKLSNIIY